MKTLRLISVIMLLLSCTALKPPTASRPANTTIDEAIKLQADSIKSMHKTIVVLAFKIDSLIYLLSPVDTLIAGPGISIDSVSLKKHMIRRADATTIKQ